MVLLMNLDTLGRAQDESAMQAISEIFREACLTVIGADCTGVTNNTPAILNRSGRGSFTMPFKQLKAQVQEMGQPVTTARTGVINV